MNHEVNPIQNAYHLIFNAGLLKLPRIPFVLLPVNLTVLPGENTIYFPLIINTATSTQPAPVSSSLTLIPLGALSLWLLRRLRQFIR
jgi:hypothetical protein